MKNNIEAPLNPVVGEIQSADGRKISPLIVLVRSVHTLFTLFFLTCIGTVYYAGIFDRPSIWAYLAAASLVLEGVVVGLNHGDCPLGFIHHKVGDEKTFFELLLPREAAKQAVPVLGVIAGIGIALLLARAFL
jgi:hypothetical protein